MAWGVSGAGAREQPAKFDRACPLPQALNSDTIAVRIPGGFADGRLVVVNSWSWAIALPARPAETLLPLLVGLTGAPFEWKDPGFTVTVVSVAWAVRHRSPFI